MQQPLWQKAASFAARGHEHQYRDDDETPYFSHPARVAMTLSQLFGCTDEAAIAAAFLHDSIEDTGAGYDDLKDEFGPDVANLVVALTKNMMLPSAKRQEDYLQRLAKADWRARLRVNTPPIAAPQAEVIVHVEDGDTCPSCLERADAG